MASLNRLQLTKARTYINSNGSGRNAISLLMELGQLLRVSPVFETWEAEKSTVHLHVFVCEVTFADFTERAEGYNKKHVRSDAAKRMIELLRQPTLSPRLSKDARVYETARTSANLVRAFCNENLSGANMLFASPINYSPFDSS